MRVRQLSSDLDLAQETISAKGSREIWTQYLERYPTLVFLVCRNIHDRRATTREFTLYAVAIAYLGVQALQYIVHADPRHPAAMPFHPAVTPR
jgi:hypothetical protein